LARECPEIALERQRPTPLHLAAHVVRVARPLAVGRAGHAARAGEQGANVGDAAVFASGVGKAAAPAVALVRPLADRALAHVHAADRGGAAIDRRDVRIALAVETADAGGAVARALASAAAVGGAAARTARRATGARAAARRRASGARAAAA